MSDQDERLAVRNGEWRAAARLAYRRGDRGASIAYLAREGCEALAARAQARQDRRCVWACAPVAGVHVYVREALSSIVPGRWGQVARGTLLPRLPRLTDEEGRALKAVVLAFRRDPRSPMAAWHRQMDLDTQAFDMPGPVAMRDDARELQGLGQASARITREGA